jgi:hypothetical protein
VAGSMATILPASPRGRGAGEDWGKTGPTTGAHLSTTVTWSGRHVGLVGEDGSRRCSNMPAQRENGPDPFSI